MYEPGCVDTQRVAAGLTHQSHGRNLLAGHVSLIYFSLRLEVLIAS